MAKVADMNQYESRFNTDTFNTKLGEQEEEYSKFTFPQLQSNIGANGQLGNTGGAAELGKSKLQQQIGYGDLTTAFERTQIDLMRNSVYASMGIML